MSPESEKWTQYYEAHIRKQELPRHLYKFRRWHCGHESYIPTNECGACKRDRLILTDQAIWFASPATFNDPFDCRIPFRFDLIPKDEQFKRVRELGSEVNPSWTEEKLQTEAEYAVRTAGVFSEDPEIREPAMRKYWQSISETYGVLSFAGEFRSILLWSHYADSHRGYCIEIDAHQLAKELFDLHRTDEHFVDVHRVVYREKLPIIIPSNDQNEDLKRHMTLLTTKSSAWKYEREYRFIYVAKTNLARSISKGAIKRVILGCQMSPHHREEICELVSMQLPNTEVWEAVKSPDEFKLEFQPMKSGPALTSTTR